VIGFLFFETLTSLFFLTLSETDEDHVPKILRKKIQKERVENAMKNGGQRVAIDFTLSEDMSNKVSHVLFSTHQWKEPLSFHEAIPIKCFVSHSRPTELFKNERKKFLISLPAPFSRVFPSLIRFVHILKRV